MHSSAVTENVMFLMEEEKSCDRSAGMRLEEQAGLIARGPVNHGKEGELYAEPNGFLERG